MSEQSIYLDFHSTTPMFPEVWEAMRLVGLETFGNPSSSHGFGRKARQILDQAKSEIAYHLGADPDEVIFTSGATEANNLAITGLISNSPGEILFNEGEHPSVVEPVKQLATRGYTPIPVPLTHEGYITKDAVTSRITEQTQLITTMLVNHETGTIQQIRELVEGSEKIPFHTDASQAVGKISVDFHQLGVTALTLSAHKFHGPKGVGGLLLRRGTKLNPTLWGGHQQKGFRPGTESPQLALGMATALALCCRELENRFRKVAQLRQGFLDVLQREEIRFSVNGANDGSPFVLNISFPECRAELLLMKLDLAGVACSAGSACSSGSLLPSPVLRAMGTPEVLLHSAIRVSFDPNLSLLDVQRAAFTVVRSVREMLQDTPEETW